MVSVVFGFLLVAIGDLHDASRLARRAADVGATASRLERLVIDMQTGQRGYILTGDERFLEPWQEGLDDRQDAVALLEEFTLDREQRVRVRDIAAAVEDYVQSWSLPLVELARVDRNAAAELLAGGEGKRLIDALRVQFDEFALAQEALEDERQASAATAKTQAVWIGAGGLAAVVLLVLLSTGYVVRAVVGPIRRLTDAAARVTGGDLAARVPEGAGEAGRLGQAFNEMTASLEQSRADLEQQNARLAEARAALEQLVEATPDALVIVNERGEIVRVNAQAERLLEYGREELVGQPVELLVPASLREGHLDHRDAYFADPRTRPMGSGMELFAVTKIGRELPVEISLSPFQTDEGTLAIAAIRDVSQRKAAEQQMRSLNAELERRLGELEQFTYVASHDLQEPLRMVVSYCQLLSHRYGDRLDGEAAEFLHFAVDGAQRMQALIQDLLDYSRASRENRPLEPIDLEEAFRRASANLEAAIVESGARITHDPLPIVLGDGTQLVQLFQNLLGNAIKFRRGMHPEIHVGLVQTHGEMVVSIRDDGIGLDPKYADRIFTVFERLHGMTEYSGTGIGLAICLKIVERHGGRIWVESEPGRGATFSFTLQPASERGSV